MFKIGEFSQFSRVSVKMLRHYDRLGLLQPAHVDPFTNYRYYTADQLPRLQRILALKDLGFSLEQIRRLLDEQPTMEQVEGMLKLRRAEIQERLRQEQERLARIETRLAHIRQTRQMLPYDVVVRTVAPQRVASIRRRVGVGAGTITALFEELEAYVGRHDARAPRPPLLLNHDHEYCEESRDVEVAVPVLGPLPAGEPITVRDLPGHEAMACIVHTGGYEALDRAFALLLSWLEQHEYAIAGPTREAYLRFGADQQGYALPDVYLATSAADFVTEIQIPVSKS